MEEKCCDAAIHSQIAYMRSDGVTVESLNGHLAGGESVRKFLHDSLDEWLTKRVAGGEEDHFIVFGKWPTELR